DIHGTDQFDDGVNMKTTEFTAPMSNYTFERSKVTSSTTYEKNPTGTFNSNGTHFLASLKMNSTHDIVMPNLDSPIVQYVFLNSKPHSYARAAGASSSTLNKVNANFHSLVSKNLCDGVKLTIPMKVVEAASTRFENTFYGYFIGKRVAFLVVEYYVRNNWGKYGLTRIMINSKGFFFFKFDTSKGLEDVLESGPWMIRFSKETIHVEYKGKPSRYEQCNIFGHLYDHCPKNATAIPTGDMKNDGFQTVAHKRKSGKTGSVNINRSGANVDKATLQPIKLKVRYEPKSHEKSLKNGAPNVSTSAKDAPNK
ncbi:zinc knuckle CX2CX4HX4C containing protein, partial [Tanacetum coccineum]